MRIYITLSLFLFLSGSIKGIKKEERHFMVKRKRERERERRGGFGSAFLPLFGFAFICSNRARKWIAGRWNEKQKRMNRRISENNTLCPRSTDYHYHPPSPFYQPSRNELHKYLATDGIRRYDAARAFNRGKRYRLLLAKYCLRSIYLVSFPTSSQSSIPSFSTNRRYFYWAENCLSPGVEEDAIIRGNEFFFFPFFSFFFWQVEYLRTMGRRQKL